MEKELAFCEKHCGKLTDIQKEMTINQINKGNFLGVARPLAGAGYMPLIMINEYKVNVINKAGYFDFASYDRIGFKN